jgi:hypothetical protein
MKRNLKGFAREVATHWVAELPFKLMLHVLF